MKKVSKVNMRDLAALAGVSVMTVSRSLRNSPKISETTRKKVQRIAKEQGYRISPLVSAQMASIRAKRMIKYEATIGLLIFTPPEGMWVGARKVIDGVLNTGEEMGFRMDLFDMAEKNFRPERLSQTLKARGIQGVIEAPMLEGISHYDIDFSELIVVSSNPGSLPQIFHRVCPDHYGNMDMLLRKLYEHGFRRPGLMVPHDLDRRFNHLWTSRFLAFQQTEKLGKVPPYMPAHTHSFTIDRFLKWFDRYNPDVLIVSSQELFQDGFFESAGLTIPEDIEVVKININDTGKGFSGIDMRSEVVGAGCVKLLSQLLYNNEFGKPENPMSNLVPGRWVPGNMCPTLESEIA